MDKEMILIEGYAHLVEDCTAELNRLINAVSQAIKIEVTADGIQTTCSLSKDDLCALAMRIPSECAYVQSKLNNVALEQAIEMSALEKDNNEEFLQSYDANEKHTAKERQAKADIRVYDKTIVNAAKKQTIKNIQQAIDRADRVYEGIKKVMDLYNRDSWINKKGG